MNSVSHRGSQNQVHRLVAYLAHTEAREAERHSLGPPQLASVAWRRAIRRAASPGEAIVPLPSQNRQRRLVSRERELQKVNLCATAQEESRIGFRAAAIGG